jgi:hypothetical protein
MNRLQRVAEKAHPTAIGILTFAAGCWQKQEKLCVNASVQWNNSEALTTLKI